MNEKAIEKYKKIWIIGSVASGKTTLAIQCAKKMNSKQFELDNLEHIRRRSGDVRRTQSEINHLLERVFKLETWIVEGVYRESYKAILDEVDCIVIMDTPRLVRSYRIIIRWMKQKFGYENSNYDPSFKMLKSMFRWSLGFDKNYSEFEQIIAPYSDKVIKYSQMKS